VGADDVDIRDSLAYQYALNDHYSRQGLGYYLDSVVINSSPEPTRFGLAADPWQRELIAAKMPAVEGLAGIAPYSGPLSFLTILPRGHDKSSLEGRILNYLLAYSKRRIDGYLVAADLDQGRLIVDAMRDEALLNPWFAQHLEFKRYEVSGPAGKVEVVPADAGSAFGFRGNLYVLDEVTHWKDGIGEKIWGAIVSGREKRKDSLLIAITNAQVIGSWQDELLIKTAMEDPEEWSVFYRKGQIASWMTPERIEKVRKLLPSAVARRVLDNEAIDPTVESGYLDPANVWACETPGLAVHPIRIPGYSYVVSLDYGPTKDRTVGVVGHLDEQERVVVDVMDVWEGKKFPTGKVPVALVDAWLDRQLAHYRPAATVIDPYQMEGTIQRLQDKPGVDPKSIIPFAARAGQGNMDMAMLLRSLIMTGRVKWLPGTGLIGERDSLPKELIALVTRVMVYGWRLDHSSGKHDDRAVGLGMMMTEAVKHRYVAQVGTGGEIVPAKPAPTQYGTEASVKSNPLVGWGRRG
jgi:hypothetical protein